MSGKRSDGGEVVGEDLMHEKVEWKIERVGWVVWALIILAALAGLLGQGLLSQQIAGDKTSPLWVEYQRFERYQSPTKLVIHATTDQPQMRLWINSGFIKKVEVSHIDPEPERVEVGSDRYVYPIAVTDRNKEVVISIYFKYNESGIRHIELGAENGHTLRFWELVYP